MSSGQTVMRGEARPCVAAHRVSSPFCGPSSDSTDDREDPRTQRSDSGEISALTNPMSSPQNECLSPEVPEGTPLESLHATMTTMTGSSCSVPICTAGGCAQMSLRTPSQSPPPQRTAVSLTDAAGPRTRAEWKEPWKEPWREPVKESSWALTTWPAAPLHRDTSTPSEGTTAPALHRSCFTVPDTAIVRDWAASSAYTQWAPGPEFAGPSSGADVTSPPDSKPGASSGRPDSRAGDTEATPKRFTSVDSYTCLPMPPPPGGVADGHSISSHSSEPMPTSASLQLHAHSGNTVHAPPGDSQLRAVSSQAQHQPSPSGPLLLPAPQLKARDSPLQRQQQLEQQEQKPSRQSSRSQDSPAQQKEPGAAHGTQPPITPQQSQLQPALSKQSSHPGTASSREGMPPLPRGDAFSVAAPVDTSSRAGSIGSREARVQPVFGSCHNSHELGASVALDVGSQSANLAFSDQSLSLQMPLIQQPGSAGGVGDDSAFELTPVGGSQLYYAPVQLGVQSCCPYEVSPHAAPGSPEHLLYSGYNALMSTNPLASNNPLAGMNQATTPSSTVADARSGIGSGANSRAASAPNSGNDPTPAVPGPNAPMHAPASLVAYAGSMAGNYPSCSSGAQADGAPAAAEHAATDGRQKTSVSVGVGPAAAPSPHTGTHFNCKHVGTNTSAPPSPDALAAVLAAAAPPAAAARRSVQMQDFSQQTELQLAGEIVERASGPATQATTVVVRQQTTTVVRTHSPHQLHAEAFTQAGGHAARDSHGGGLPPAVMGGPVSIASGGTSGPAGVLVPVPAAADAPLAMGPSHAVPVAESSMPIGSASVPHALDGGGVSASTWPQESKDREENEFLHSETNTETLKLREQIKQLRLASRSSMSRGHSPGPADAMLWRTGSSMQSGSVVSGGRDVAHIEALWVLPEGSVDACGRGNMGLPASVLGAQTLDSALAGPERLCSVLSGRPGSLGPEDMAHVVLDKGFNSRHGISERHLHARTADATTTTYNTSPPLSSATNSPAGIARRMCAKPAADATPQSSTGSSRVFRASIQHLMQDANAKFCTMPAMPALPAVGGGPSPALADIIGGRPGAPGPGPSSRAEVQDGSDAGGLHLLDCPVSAYPKQRPASEHLMPNLPFLETMRMGEGEARPPRMRRELYASLLGSTTSSVTELMSGGMAALSRPTSRPTSTDTMTPGGASWTASMLGVGMGTYGDGIYSGDSACGALGALIACVRDGCFAEWEVLPVHEFLPKVRIKGKRRRRLHPVQRPSDTEAHKSPKKSPAKAREAAVRSGKQSMASSPSRGSYPRNLAAVAADAVAAAGSSMATLDSGPSLNSLRGALAVRDHEVGRAVGAHSGMGSPVAAVKARGLERERLSEDPPCDSGAVSEAGSKRFLQRWLSGNSHASSVLPQVPAVEQSGSSQARALHGSSGDGWLSHFVCGASVVDTDCGPSNSGSCHVAPSSSVDGASSVTQPREPQGRDSGRQPRVAPRTHSESHARHGSGAEAAATGGTRARGAGTRPELLRSGQPVGDLRGSRQQQQQQPTKVGAVGRASHAIRGLLSTRRTGGGWAGRGQQEPIVSGDQGAAAQERKGNSMRLFSGRRPSSTAAAGTRSTDPSIIDESMSTDRDAQQPEPERKVAGQWLFTSASGSLQRAHAAERNTATGTTTAGTSTTCTQDSNTSQRRFFPRSRGLSRTRGGDTGTAGAEDSGREGGSSRLFPRSRGLSRTWTGSRTGGQQVVNQGQDGGASGPQQQEERPRSRMRFFPVSRGLSRNRMGPEKETLADRQLREAWFGPSAGRGQAGDAGARDAGEGAANGSRQRGKHSGLDGDGGTRDRSQRSNSKLSKLFRGNRAAR